MSTYTSRSVQDQEGQGLTEYALILMLVAMALVAVIGYFGGALRNTYCHIMYELPFDMGGSSDCTQPHAQARLIERGPDYINLAAQVRDPDGDPEDPYGAIDRVEFYMDSASTSPVQIEYIYQYCLGGGDNTCQNYYIGDLSAGEHVVIIKVYDDDGNVGVAYFSFMR